MSRRFRRTSLVSSLAACAAVAGPVAAAQASDATLRSTVTRALPAIARSQTKILNGLSTLDRTHKAAALIKAINTQDKTLTTLETKLTGEAPSSAAGTKGKADIIAGLKLIVSSNHTVTKELKKASRKQAVSTAQLKAADNAEKAGNRKLNAGAKLLKIK